MSDRAVVLIITISFALVAAIVGCSRESAESGKFIASNGNEAKHGAGSAKAHRHRDNTVHILRKGANPAVDEQRIDFGEAKQGKTYLHSFELANPRPEPVVIEAMTSSCECFSIPGLPRRIPEKKRTLVATAIDLSTEPDFHGDLAIDVHLQSGGSDVAMFKAAISVVPEPAATPAPKEPSGK